MAGAAALLTHLARPLTAATVNGVSLSSARGSPSEISANTIAVIGIGKDGIDAINDVVDVNETHRAKDTSAASQMPPVRYGVTVIAIDTEPKTLERARTENSIKVGANLGSHALTRCYHDLRLLLPKTETILLAVNVDDPVGWAVANPMVRLTGLTSADTTGPTTVVFPVTGDAPRQSPFNHDRLDYLATFASTSVPLDCDAPRRKSSLAQVLEAITESDFDEGALRAILRKRGRAVTGMGTAMGDNRATLAADAAMAESRANGLSIKGAQGLIVKIYGGQDATLYEADQALAAICRHVGMEADVLVDAQWQSHDDPFITVSLIATGIPSELDLQNHRIGDRWLVNA